MISLTLMSRPDCPLCDEMLAELEALAAGRARIRIVDISEDDDLTRKYVFEIPVLLHGDRELSRHRLGREQVMRCLDQHSG
jgi:hypothetical protein